MSLLKSVSDGFFDRKSLPVRPCHIKCRFIKSGAYSSHRLIESRLLRHIKVHVQTITLGPLPNKTLSDPPFTVSATSSAGLPVSLSSDTPNACTTSGSLVTLLNAGACTITASQAGDGTYNPAQLVSRSFAITSPDALTHKTYLTLIQR